MTVTREMHFSYPVIYTDSNGVRRYVVVRRVSEGFVGLGSGTGPDGTLIEWATCVAPNEVGALEMMVSMFEQEAAAEREHGTDSQ